MHFGSRCGGVARSRARRGAGEQLFGVARIQPVFDPCSLQIYSDTIGAAALALHAQFAMISFDHAIGVIRES